MIANVHKPFTGLLILLSLLISGCSRAEIPGAAPAPARVEAGSGDESQSPDPSLASTGSPAATSIPAAADKPAATRAASTNTPLPASSYADQAAVSETVEATSTAEYPQAVIQMQANCRYGPGKAYLYSHGLYSGDQVEVHGRSYAGTWLWIKPANLARHCWAAASVMEIAGDVSHLKIATTTLPHSTLYGPPENVQAYRQGDTVVITWDAVWMTADDDRGYLIEATVCQNGNLIGVAVQTDQAGYELNDERTCGGPSGGMLYTVEKHGYTDPVEIPWP